MFTINTSLLKKIRAFALMLFGCSAMVGCEMNDIMEPPKPWEITTAPGEINRLEGDIISPTSGLRHPGCGINAELLNNMKKEYDAGSQLYEKFANSRWAKITYKRDEVTGELNELGHENVGRGSSNENRTDYEFDCQAALYQAIQYYCTGIETYAETATAIIHGWATKHKNWVGSESYFLAQGNSCDLVAGAEILRYTYPKWTQQNTDELIKYLDEVVDPLVNIMVGQPLRAANQGAIDFNGAITHAVFKDDKDKFEKCLYAFQYDGMSSIYNLILPNGQNGDSGRDSGHARGLLSALTNAVEVAWQQGYDLYRYPSAEDARLLRGCEYFCKSLLQEGDPNWIPFGGYGAAFPAVATGLVTDGLTCLDIAYMRYKQTFGMDCSWIEQYPYKWVDANSFFYKYASNVTIKVPEYIQSLPAFKSFTYTSLNSADLQVVTINVDPSKPAPVVERNGNAGSLSGYGTWTDDFKKKDDSFTFLYIPITGDGSFKVKITGWDKEIDNASVGVMVRDFLTKDANFAEVGWSRKWQKVNDTDQWVSAPTTSRSRNGSNVSNGRDLDAYQREWPYWFILERRGDRIAIKASSKDPDVEYWIPKGECIMPNNETLYFGIYVAPKDDSKGPLKVSFSDLQIGTLSGE